MIKVSSKINVGTAVILYISLISLIIVCVFDPSDKILQIKTPLFILCWMIFSFNIIITKKNVKMPPKMLFYISLLLFIPILSILYYTVTDGREPYAGYEYLKGFLFPTAIIILHVSRIDLSNTFCIVVTMLSITIITMFFITIEDPVSVPLLREFGYEYGAFWLGERIYGNVAFATVFYKTSPIIAIAISYYVFLSMVETGAKKVAYILVSAINIYAMFLAGTRSNILMAIFLPFLIIFIYSKNRRKIFFLLLSVVTILSILFCDIGKDMLDPHEYSNAIKLAYWDDYFRVFSNPFNLLFGQGIGAYNYWTVLGEETALTELTFLEIFRNYGLIGGLPLLGLILFPLSKISRRSSPILVGYACYLIMSFSNPLLFGSTGMMVLVVIITSLFLNKTRVMALDKKAETIRSLQKTRVVTVV